MSFHISLSFPFDHIHQADEFVTMQAVKECAQAAEEAGFTSGTVTDHPVPSSRWLDKGENCAQDPFVMLSMVAAVTTKLKLQTNVLVLPYRNPFITARAVSSLDVFSGGRVILGLGAGYLKGECKALGVDFDRRNDLVDEYMQAMKLAWTGEDFTFEGTGYTAPGNRVRPAPLQKPHPPLLVGGNSKRALRRAVEHGDAWHPFFLPKKNAGTGRTAAFPGDREILAAIDYIKEYSEQTGREVPPDIICSTTFTMKDQWSAQEALDSFAHLQSLGIKGTGASIEAESRSEWCDHARRFGEDVIAKLG